MTTPVEVACNALRSDADTWNQTSAALQGGATSANQLVLGPDKLGMKAQERGLVAVYEALRARLGQLLAGGGTEHGSLSAVLRQAANTYEAEDKAGLHRISQAGGN
jgi:hypothetical protein